MTATATPVALVTGASRGIGRAVARRLLVDGHHVVLASRDDTTLLQTADELRQESSAFSLETLAVDVADEGAVKGLFQLIQRQHKRLDVLVNAAGILREAPLSMTRSSDLAALFGVNVYGAYFCCQYASRLMGRSGSGVIVNFASVVGEQGAEGQSAYAASKAAVSGLTRSLAKELAPMGIRVNAVAPGFIDTDMTAHYDAEQRSRVLDRTLMKRAGTAEEVADVVACLVSPGAGYITGQVIPVDGGMRL